MMSANSASQLYIDLQLHEAAGGHTIRSHVSITDNEMRQRLASDLKIMSATKFADLQAAEAAVNSSIGANLTAFLAWLRSSKMARQEFDYDAGMQIGYGFRRSLPPYPVVGPSPLRKVRVIVTRGNAGLGFLLLTAFPIA
jgi:hypothetical protein